MNKKIIYGLLLSTTAVGILAGCGKEKEPEPSGPDLSQNVTLKISNNYDANTGMKYSMDKEYTTPSGVEIKKGDFKPVYAELQSKFNMTIDDVTEAGKKAVDQFKENWGTNHYGDIVSGNVANIQEQSVAGDKESILDLTKYLENGKLPNFKAFLQSYPTIATQIRTSKHASVKNEGLYGIYYLPYFDGVDDLEKMTILRADFVEKLLDADLQDSDFDTNASLWAGPQYQAHVKEDYSVTVPSSMDADTTKSITKAGSVKNIIEQQNEIEAANRTSLTMVKQLRKYIDDRYGSQFKKRSDLFLGVDSCYDADEMIALMRCVLVSPKLLTGDAKKVMVPFVPREYNNQRIADLYRWGAQLFGFRGLESRSGYIWVDSDGKIHDARGENNTIELLKVLNNLYSEGLILKDFEKQATCSVNNGKFAEKLIVGYGTSEVKDEAGKVTSDGYCGFMEYDYAQTQGAWNDKDASKAIADYNFRPIMGAVAKLDVQDAKLKGKYVHFTESWRSVKSQGWCLNADLANDPTKLERALAFVDYFYSAEGQELNSFGPASYGYINGKTNYMGKEIAKLSDKALEQLNDNSIGGGSYTNYLRLYVGATLPVGYVKEQGMEYQMTTEKTRNGLAIINKAIELGTYYHLELETVNTIKSDKFFTISPSSFPISSGESTTKTALEAADKLGQFNSNGSTKTYNTWDKYVMFGFGNTTGTITWSVEEYKSQVNGEANMNLPALVKIYQDAFDLLSL